MFKAKWVSLILILVLVASLMVLLLACGNEDIDNPVETSGTTEDINNPVETPGTTYYTVTFNDYDGTLLYETSVLEGTIPEYAKSNPTRAKDANYKYIFRGWSPNLEKVTKDATYTAQYSKEDLPYSISFDLNGGSSISELKSFKTDEITKEDFVYNITKQKYAFRGWSYNGQIVFNKNGEKVYNFTPTYNMIFKAEFEEQVTLKVYYTVYNPNDNELLDTFDTLPTNMGSVSKTRSYPWNTNVNLFANPNEGYTFVGWYYQKNGTTYPLSSEANYNYMMWDEDFTVEARFKYTLYDLKVLANHPENGQVIIRNDTVYQNTSTKEKYFTEKVTIAAVTKTDVRFLGWYDEDNHLVITNAVYSFDMMNRDYTLEAKWDYFTISYDLDGGVNNINNPTSYNSNMNNIPLLNPTKELYTFDGWYYNNEKVTEIDTQNICDMQLKAKWASYTVTTTSNNTSAGSTNYSAATKVTAGNNVTITATTNTGYTFVGWYKSGEQVTTNPSYTFAMPAKNVIYEARWSTNSYTITIDNQAIFNGVTISGVTSGSSYEYNSVIALTAAGIPSGYTIKWERSDGVSYIGGSYAFNMPACAITIAITIITVPYAKDGNVVYFGSYPQTKVIDSMIESALNSQRGILPTASNSQSWTDYGYYINGSVRSYMWYKDVEYQNNKYRGVYFIQYRPGNCLSTSSASNSYQDDNGYQTSIVYWFKFEPIKWRVLTESDGKALLLADLILDSQHYEPRHADVEYSHNGGTGYANNYELSHIRSWLNDNFYNTAFNAEEQALIATVTVDNSVSSTGYSSNSYACSNTSDKIFLLSYSEATNSSYGLNSDSARQAKGSDFAKSQGLLYSYNCYWWLRSPHPDHAYLVRGVGNGGTTDSRYAVGDAGGGVRPALWLQEI